MLDELLGLDRRLAITLGLACTPHPVGRGEVAAGGRTEDAALGPASRRLCKDHGHRSEKPYNQVRESHSRATSFEFRPDQTLRAPIRRGHIDRPRLVRLLTAGLDTELTLLSAPAGFGKTALLGEWLRQLDRPFAWLSLDRNDNAWPRCLAAS